MLVPCITTQASHNDSKSLRLFGLALTERSTFSSLFRVVTLKRVDDNLLSSSSTTVGSRIFLQINISNKLLAILFPRDSRLTARCGDRPATRRPATRNAMTDRSSSQIYRLSKRTESTESFRRLVTHRLRAGQRPSMLRVNVPNSSFSPVARFTRLRRPDRPKRINT